MSGGTALDREQLKGNPCFDYGFELVEPIISHHSKGVQEQLLCIAKSQNG